MSAEWWDRKLKRIPTMVTPTARRAVQWEEHSPPPRPVVEMSPMGDMDDPHTRVQQQGFIGKQPEGARNASVCPHCGSGNFFRRRWANKECAPLCTECGYNGDYFTQSGTLINAVGVKSAGPVQFARSDNPDGMSQRDWDHPIRVGG
jgi:hypothetical protein